MNVICDNTIEHWLFSVGTHNKLITHCAILSILLTFKNRKFINKKNLNYDYIFNLFFSSNNVYRNTVFVRCKSQDKHHFN